MSFLFILGFCFVSSCNSDCKGRKGDQSPYCEDFYFRVISKNSGTDLIYDSNVINLNEDIVICANTTLSGKQCSNGGSKSPSLGYTRKIGGLDVPSVTVCSATNAGDWSDLQITILDSIVYKIDYKLLDVETFYCLPTLDHYFLELYINGKLQCAPCEPQHITFFEIDI